jgi:hypothetical protein
VQVVALQDVTGVQRFAAVVEGPLLRPIDPRAIKNAWDISISESWMVCGPEGGPVGSWAGRIRIEAICWR